jgi:hypothetical protein
VTGDENINVGDKLLCTSNEGLLSIGGTRTVYGITESSINTIPCDTSWVSRKDFRWHCYTHLPQAASPSVAAAVTGLGGEQNNE